MNFFGSVYKIIFENTPKKFSKWLILYQMKILNLACERMYIHNNFFFFEIHIRKSFEMAETKTRKFSNFGIKTKILVLIFPVNEERSKNSITKDCRE